MLGCRDIQSAVGLGTSDLESNFDGWIVEAESASEVWTIKVELNIAVERATYSRIGCIPKTRTKVIPICVIGGSSELASRGCGSARLIALKACPLCLCGCFGRELVHHRDTEDTTRFSRFQGKI